MAFYIISYDEIVGIYGKRLPTEHTINLAESLGAQVRDVAYKTEVRRRRPARADLMTTKRTERAEPGAGTSRAEAKAAKELLFVDYYLGNGCIGAKAYLQARYTARADLGRRALPVGLI